MFSLWKKKIVNEEMINLLNITLLDDVPLSKMKPISCEWKETTKIITLELIGMKVSQNEILMEADPFRLYVIKEEEICLTKYTGSNLIIFDKNDNTTCRVRAVRRRDMYLESEGADCNKPNYLWSTE